MATTFPILRGMLGRESGQSLSSDRLTWVGDAFVPDLAHVDRIGEQVIERAASETETAVPYTTARHPLLGDNRPAVQFFFDPTQGLEFEIELKDQLHRLSFGFV